MNYWDSSALVPLFVDQPQTRSSEQKLSQDTQVVTAWHSVSECASAFCRLKREGHITESELQGLLSELERHAAHWFIITPGKRLERWTLRLLRVHPLRAMDAIHLAAACLARPDADPAPFFFTEDTRLSEAAAKEGFKTEF